MSGSGEQKLEAVLRPLLQHHHWPLQPHRRLPASIINVDPSTNTRIVYRVVTPGEMKIGAASPWENASMTPLSSGHRSPIHLLFSLKREK